MWLINSTYENKNLSFSFSPSELVQQSNPATGRLVKNITPVIYMKVKSIYVTIKENFQGDVLYWTLNVELL